MKQKGCVTVSSEMICALIAVAGTVLSALISYGVSRYTANKELEKMKMTWEREDVVSSEDEFSAMSKAVGAFVQSGRPHHQRVAMELVAAARSKESGALGSLLDELYMHIQSGHVSNTDVWLTKVINQKREAKSKANSAGSAKPIKK